MKRLINILVSVFGLAALGGGQCAFAQLTTPSTTLSVAVPAQGGNGVGNTNQQWCLASASSVALPSISQAGSYLVVDKEAAVVISQGTSTTCFYVKRGQLDTSSQYSHAAGATVWVGNVATGTGDNSRPFANGVLTANVPSGTCTASAQYSLPLIVVGGANGAFTGGAARCISGYWQTGLGPSQPLKPFTFFSTVSMPVGIATASVTDVNGKIWWAQLYAENNATLTGACLLNGATVGTDKWIFALYDAAGTLLANTATAGTTTATASKYQCIAFTSTVAITGPGTYYVAVQGNGTTDNFQSYAANGAPTNYGTGSQNGTFGTLAAITPAATFNAANGPVMTVY